MQPICDVSERVDRKGLHQNYDPDRNPHLDLLCCYERRGDLLKRQKAECVERKATTLTQKL